MPRQIGWSNESNLLYNISMQLDRLVAVTAAAEAGDGTITGGGVNGQIAFWNGATNIIGSNDLFWDNAIQKLSLFSSTSDSVVIGRQSTIAQYAQQTEISFGSFVNGSFNDTSAIRAYYTGTGTQRSGKLVLACRNITGGLRAINFGENGEIYTNGSAIPNTYPAKLFIAGLTTASTDWTAQFHNSTGTSNSLMIANDGSTILGSASNTGERLQVTGTIRVNPTTNVSGLLITGYQVTGANSTAAMSIGGTWNTTGSPTGLLVNITNTNSSITSYIADFQVNSGYILRIQRQGQVQIQGSILFANNDIQIRPPSTSVAGNETAFQVIKLQNHQSGERTMYLSQCEFNPNAGNGTFNNFAVTGLVNQTGTATGITRGFYAAPSFGAAVNWRSFESTNNVGWAFYAGGTAPSLFNGDVSIAGKLALTVVTNRQTVNYSLVLADNGKLVEMNVVTANTLTVPPNSSIAFPIGTKIDVAQYGAGQTSIVPGVGVTVRSALGALKLAAQYSGASLVKIGTDEWYLFGDITV